MLSVERCKIQDAAVGVKTASGCTKVDMQQACGRIADCMLDATVYE